MFPYPGTRDWAVPVAVLAQSLSCCEEQLSPGSLQCHPPVPSLQLYEVSADTTFTKPSDAACDVACFLYSLSDPKSFSYCASIYKVAGRDPGGLCRGPV